MSDHDPVNHPKHYTSHPSGVECITITEHMGFCVGNAIKYLWRADEKNGLEDLKKAAWYINREIEKREIAKSETFRLEPVIAEQVHGGVALRCPYCNQGHFYGELHELQSIKSLCGIGYLSITKINPITPVGNDKAGNHT